ncbi:hypothetical protein JHK87_053086 [Glycine soja]|nr:hypothetical protein JHK87_053086 [Glycine soja]
MDEQRRQCMAATVGKPGVALDEKFLLGLIPNATMVFAGITLILIAELCAGLLWMGWSGFNGGGPFVASTVASLAVLNTHVCAAASIIVWVLLCLAPYRDDD